MAPSREERAQLFESALDYLPVAIFCKDSFSDFKFILWNKKCEELFGLKREQMYGKTDYDFFPKDQADFFRKKDIETMSVKGSLEILEEPVEAPTVGTRWVHTIKAPLPDKSGKPRFLLGVTEDITERRQMQEKIEQQTLKLISKAKMASLGEMASGIAHEINNPLAIIRLNLEEMRDALNAQPQDLKKIFHLLDRMSNTSQRIGKIVRGLNSFSRNSTKDPMVRVRLTDLLHDTLEFCLERFRAKQVDLKVSVPEELEIHCRPSQISEVLLNMLNNAFDAIEGKEKPWISIEAQATDKTVRIVITDSGKGIPPEVQEKMMQPFFTTKEIGKGTGLGLSIAKGLVEDHGGELLFNSTHSNTQFVIQLPR